MGNPFVHIELSTPDLAKAKAFYGGLFDWDLQELPMGDGETYTMVNVGEGGAGGGMMTSQEPEILPNWFPYVSVDDCQAAAEKAQSLGATVIHPPAEVAGHVWFAVIQDPTGACFGICSSVGECEHEAT